MNAAMMFLESIRATARPERRGSVQETFRNYIVQAIIVFGAYVTAGKLGQATTNIRSSNLGPVWPAYGVALAAILLLGYRVWPAVAAAAFLVAFFSPVSHLAALGQAAGATVAALTGTFLLRRFAGFHTSLSCLRDALGLIAFGALGSAVLSASIGISVLYATHVHAYSGLAPAWLIYWLGDGTGVLLITPLVLTFPNLLKIRESNRIWEFVVLLVLLTATCFFVFGDLPLIPIRVHVFAFAVLPFVMWAAIDFGMSGAALSLLVIATIATVETAIGSGPFSQSSTFTNAVLLDVFFAVLSVSGLVLAAVIAEREHAVRQREETLRNQKVMEIRLRAQEAAHEGEERLRLAVQAGRMYADDWDIASDVIVRSAEYGKVLGISEPMRLTRQQLLEGVHPDDRARLLAMISRLTPQNPTGAVTYRMLLRDGVVTWVERCARALFDADGKMLRIISMIADITELKMAEDALSRINRRLIEAQEQERTRIARELHDDVAQRLALLTIELGKAHQGPPVSAAETRILMGELEQRSTAIAADIQALSHELHSSKLEILGLVATIRSWCREFRSQKQLQIDFHSHDLPQHLPSEVSLCLFRVLQEALHNAAKHSGATCFEVQLWGAADDIHLKIIDSGVGFDTETALKGQGLGLTSMKERLRLVGGELAISSHPNHGTTVYAHVPVEVRGTSEQAAS